MITAQAITRIAPAAKPYATELFRQMRGAGVMANVRRASCFLATCHVETGGFRQTAENLNYAADSLLKLFGRHRISEADAKKFGRIDADVRKRTGWKLPDQPAHQNALANILYGGEWGKKNLGNTEPGDGWRFRGRGGHMTTGRANYTRLSKAWLGDLSLLTNPERVENPDGWVASAIVFWSQNNLNEVADKQGIDGVSRVTNGGFIGIADRRSWQVKYAGAWKVQ